MKRQFTTLVCLMFVQILSLNGYAQTPPTQTFELDSDSVLGGNSWVSDVPAQFNSTGSSNNALLDATAQIDMSCPDGTETATVVCSVNTERESVECFPPRTLIGDRPSLVVASRLEGDFITFFKRINETSFAVGYNEVGLLFIDTLKGRIVNLNVDALIRDDLQDLAFFSVSGHEVELFLSDNTIWLRDRGASDMKKLVQHSDSNKLIGVSFAAIDTSSWLLALSNNGKIYVAYLNEPSPSFGEAWDLSAAFAKENFTPSQAGFEAKISTDNNLFTILDSSHEYIMRASLISKGGTATWETSVQDAPTASLSSCMKGLYLVGDVPAQDEPAEKQQECPEGLAWTEVEQNGDTLAGSGRCLCEDSSVPEVETIPGSKESTYTCPEIVEECPENMETITLASGETYCVKPTIEEDEPEIICPKGTDEILIGKQVKCVRPAETEECEEGSTLTVNDDGEEVCVLPVEVLGCDTSAGYHLITLDDGTLACGLLVVTETAEEEIPAVLVDDATIEDTVDDSTSDTELGPSPGGFEVKSGVDWGDCDCHIDATNNPSSGLVTYGTLLIFVGLWGLGRRCAKVRSSPQHLC